MPCLWVSFSWLAGGIGYGLGVGGWVQHMNTAVYGRLIHPENSHMLSHVGLDQSEGAPLAYWHILLSIIYSVLSASLCQRIIIQGVCPQVFFPFSLSLPLTHSLSFSLSLSLPPFAPLCLYSDRCIIGWLMIMRSPPIPLTHRDPSTHTLTLSNTHKHIHTHAHTHPLTLSNTQAHTHTNIHTHRRTCLQCNVSL